MAYRVRTVVKPHHWKRTAEMQYDRRVVGYHGCLRSTAREVLFNDTPFEESVNDWDWLGHGVYFWEHGHQRAFRWAERKANRDGGEPAVVGALVQLGRCLDLLDTDYTEQLAEFARDFERKMGPLPPNRPGRHEGDCRLINEFCAYMQKFGGTTFDSVRGQFQEGTRIYVGSRIWSQSHIQIAVRNPEAIVGVFRHSAYGSWR